ncbi:tetratricopeptide repeat protein [Massilia glaciei]|uniref:Sel1 repeat family protein n=1 Tax=Massilia glaciei TaxID=1524097 RepID=A0A2U2I5P0_9BURK|nr:sel1 repeat family protein [Massilia glaciei]PWF54969.1 sel1 repeat family protein [Massilia glaciei]
MKKTVICLSLLLACLGGAAHAGELADANALFAKKSYPQAEALYLKLAKAGNAEAQLHLGEMYFYGEAGMVDAAKAREWFGKSAAKGNKTAIAALEMMRQRELRRADLDYWIKGYDGAELRSGQFACKTPRIPEMSRQNDEIEAVSARVLKWQDCYNNFVRNLNEASPLTKRIPKDVVDLLSKEEMAAATAHLNAVRANLAEGARVSSKLLLADYEVWRKATDAYVGESNRIVNENRKNEIK